jgi:hypothetical protein
MPFRVGKSSKERSALKSVLDKASIRLRMRIVAPQPEQILFSRVKSSFDRFDAPQRLHRKVIKQALPLYYQDVRTASDALPIGEISEDCNNVTSARRTGSSGGCARRGKFGLGKYHRRTGDSRPPRIPLPPFCGESRRRTSRARLGRYSPPATERFPLRDPDTSASLDDLLHEPRDRWALDPLGDLIQQHRMLNVSIGRRVSTSRIVAIRPKQRN